MKQKEVEINELQNTIRDLDAGNLIDFKVCIVQLRKDISELKSEVIDKKFYTR